MHGVINIAVTIDRNYIQPAGVMLISLLQNTHSEVIVYLLHPDLIIEDKKQINAVISKYKNSQIKYIKVSNDTFSDFVVTGHFSSVMYYKLCFGGLLPQNVERILYLDPDTLVLSDIQELWEYNLGDSLYSAVPLQLRTDIENIIDKTNPYFSCGVMLINLGKWRRERWDQKLLQTAHDLAGSYNGAPEMQILAAGTSGEAKNMPIFWNWWPDMRGYRGSYTKKDLKRIKKREGIVHFPHNIKPWHYACSHPLRGVYVRYRKGTPWEKVALENKNLVSFVLRFLPYRISLLVIKKRFQIKAFELIRKKYVC